MPYRYADVSGCATYVHHTGATALPERPPPLGRGERIVCLHGAGGNQGCFDPLVEELSEAHSLVAFDQPAHGRSGGLDSLGSIDQLAKFTGELLGALRIERPVLLGNSMGAAVALQLALSQPRQVRALVLCAGADRYEGAAAEIETTRRVVEGKERRSFSRAIYGPDATPEVMQRGFMEDLKTDPRARLGDLLACRDWQAGPGLASLAVPTLVVRGEHEIDALAAGADRLAETIPGARRVVVPGAGHRLVLEQPRALAAAVRDFLAELSS